MPLQLQEIEAPPPSRESTAATAFPAARPPDDDFGFDFGDTEPAPLKGAAAGFGTPPSVPTPSEPAAETEEDLWSEVSLRDQGTDVLEAPSPAVAVSWPGPVGSLDDRGGPSADETVFEEVVAARAEPAPEAVWSEEVAPEEFPEPPAAPIPSPVLAGAPAGAAVVDTAQIERIVASRLEEAVRQVLTPLVNELAKKTLEEIAWEVIPDLAEAMIRAEIERVRQATSTG